MNRKLVAGSVVLLPLLDTLVSVLPIPAEYNLMIKIPALLGSFIVALFFVRKGSRSRFVWVSIVGGVFIFIYLALTHFVLFHNETYHRPGDTSVVGLWLTAEAKEEMSENRWTLAALHQEYAPKEWVLIYSKASQMGTVLVLALFYALGFILLVYGIGSYTPKTR